MNNFSYVSFFDPNYKLGEDFNKSSDIKVDKEVASRALSPEELKLNNENFELKQDLGLIGGCFGVINGYNDILIDKKKLLVNEIDALTLENKGLRFDNDYASAQLEEAKNIFSDGLEELAAMYEKAYGEFTNCAHSLFDNVVSDINVMSQSHLNEVDDLKMRLADSRENEVEIDNLLQDTLNELSATKDILNSLVMAIATAAHVAR